MKLLFILMTQSNGGTEGKTQDTNRQLWTMLSTKMERKKVYVCGGQGDAHLG